ncbi:MAG: hypothetical protein QME96_12345 [Myxococcota bacterium]|nr:hypothetical protein [Myxococcota bacterium]
MRHRLDERIPERGPRRCVGLLLVGVGMLAACGPAVPTIHGHQRVDHLDGDDPLRVHTLDGMLFVLDRWQAGADAIVGEGREYDADRRLVRSGHLTVARDRVAVLETRARRFPMGGVVVMGIATGVSLIGTAVCAANPKACFGSCPTFYVEGADGPEVQAEGFSSSVARILEAEDVDPLPDAAVRDGFVVLEMRNEALETHAVRSLELVRASGPPGTRIAVDSRGRFLALGAETAPHACEGGPPDCVERLAARDGLEVRWDADPSDLAAQTEVVLAFGDPGSGEIALTLTIRNTLMSTFVMYHMLALYGTEAGAFYARIERGEPEALLGLMTFGRLLGGIEVAVAGADGSWRDVGTARFTGPIARDEVAFRVGVRDRGDPLRVRLTLPRAHWRIDRAGVAPIVAEATSRSIAPTTVERDGVFDARALAAVRGEGDRLVTWPGDSYFFRFAAPPDGDESVGWFLRSRGYYYEWIRESWLEDQDPVAAERFLRDPAAALRELAPLWIEMAPAADAIFEESRFSGRAP